MIQRKTLRNDASRANHPPISGLSTGFCSKPPPPCGLAGRRSNAASFAARQTRGRESRSERRRAGHTGAGHGPVGPPPRPWTGPLTRPSGSRTHQRPGIIGQHDGPAGSHFPQHQRSPPTRRRTSDQQPQSPGQRRVDLCPTRRAHWSPCRRWRGDRSSCRFIRDSRAGRTRGARHGRTRRDHPCRCSWSDADAGHQRTQRTRSA